ncbi:MAG: anthrone oxygenase family protein [Pseudomonadota bacterium]
MTFPTATTLPALLLIGLMAGFFYAFSVCVMPGLNRVAPGTAIEAMQGINEAVRNPVFFVTFFLTPVMAIISALVLWRSGNAAAALWVAGGGLTYLLGALVLTAQINVPMNNALALVEPTVSNAETVWRDYSGRWTFWNNVRTAVSTVAMLMIGIGMLTPLR